MISRSTLIAALVVVELAIVGTAVRSFGGGGGGDRSGSHGWGPFGFGRAEAAVRTPLDRHFATGLAPHVVIEVGDVGVTIQTAPGPDVHVVERLEQHGWVSGSVPPVRAEQTADGVRIVSPSGSGMHVVMGELVHELLVTVPATATLAVTGGDRIAATGLRARFTGHTDNGAIRLRDHQGDVDATSSNGRVELIDVRAAGVKVHTDNGRLVLTRVVADRLEASTDNGRIVAAAVRLADGAITTSNGRISVAYTADSDATLTAHTSAGRLDVAGSGAAAAEDGNDEGGDENHQRVLRLGAGRGRFEISTDNGSIHLTQGGQV